jgi:hypothetical protein
VRAYRFLSNFAWGSRACVSYSSTLKMEATRSSENQLTFDGLHHRYDNLKSFTKQVFLSQKKKLTASCSLYTPASNTVTYAGTGHYLQYTLPWWQSLISVRQSDSSQWRVKRTRGSYNFISLWVQIWAQYPNQPLNLEFSFSSSVTTPLQMEYLRKAQWTLCEFHLSGGIIIKSVETARFKQCNRSFQN